MKQTTYSFNSERGKKDGGISRDLQDEKKIFFGILNFNQNKGDKTYYTEAIFKEHGFTEAAPSFVISPIDLKRPNTMKDFYDAKTRWIMGRGGMHDSQSQINYINGILSTDV